MSVNRASQILTWQRGAARWGWSRWLGFAWLCLGCHLLSAATGPLLSDSNLFSALNLNYPGLELVRTNVTQGDYAAAKSNLAAYVRARTNVNWYWDPHQVTNNISFSQSAADQTTNGYTSQIGIGYTFSNGVINWYYNVTKDPNFNYAPNNEWQWQLNRMNFWPNVANTWWGTGDDAYVKSWAAQFRSWITNCPVPSARSNITGSTWRTIESGIRMNSNWPNTFFRVLTSPSFTDQDICDYLKSNIEHARYLSNFFTGNNFLTMEMSGLYTVGAVFPEVSHATSWRDFASLTLYKEQTNQFYPDGPQKELSTGYHGVSVGNILTIYTVAAMENRVAELPSNYLANLEVSYSHYLRLMTPERTMPQFNDAIGVPNAKSYLDTAAQLFTNRLDYLWVSTDGAEGAPPSFTSCNYPWAGYNVMRSGWDRAANYLCLDNGPLGAGHQHQDKLNVVVWAYGRRILFDSGGGNYETSIWRSYGTSSYSHNTVVVDGRDQAGGDGSAAYSDPDYVSQAPVNSRWETDVAHDFAAGFYNLGYSNYTYRPALHTRRVLFVKPELYLVADTLAPTNTAAHTYEARWHLLPTNIVFNASTKAVTTTDSGLANLAVVPCLLSNLTVTTTSGQSNASYRLLLGWNIIGSQPGHTPATTVSHTLTATGTNQFLTLLMPLDAGATNPVTNVVALGQTAARLELSDGRRLLVSADPSPARGLGLIELLPNGTTNRIAGGGFSPPVISAIPDQTNAPNTVIGPLPFTLSGTNLNPANLVLIGRSQNDRLVSDAGIVFGGAGSNRTVTITTVPGRAGSAEIQITALDTNGATTTISFNVNILVPTTTAWYWDTSAAAGLQAGSGSWSEASALWSATNAGSSPLLTWPATGNDANFIGAGGAYNISIVNTQNVGDLLTTNGTFTLSGGALNHFAGPMNFDVSGTATVNVPLVADTDLTKVGSGTLSFGAPVECSGIVYVKNGTLQLTADNLLPAGSDVVLGNGSVTGRLDLSLASQGFNNVDVVTTNSSGTNTIVIGAGKTLGIGGAVMVGTDNGTNSITRLKATGGTLLVTNGGQNFAVGRSSSVGNAHGNTATLDLTKLASVILGTADSALGELRIAYGYGSGSSTNFLALSDTNNLITAATVQVGNSIGYNGSTGTLLLGAGTNVIAADTLNLGLSKVSGTVKFASPAPGPGSVVIRGKSGPAADLYIGFKNGTGTAGNPVSTLDLRGHNATVTADSLNLGIENGSSTGGDNGFLYFDNGTFDVTNVTVGAKSGTSTGGGNGTLNIGGGTFTVWPGGSFTLGSLQGTGAASGTLIVTGGTFNCYADILKSGAAASTVTLNGGTLNLFGNDLGSTNNLNTLNFQAGTLLNVGEINAGAAGVVKTGASTLTLGGTNRYTGGTVVSAGTLFLNGSVNSALAVNAGALAGGGTINGALTVASGTKWQARLLGLTPNAGYDQLQITGSNNLITLAGSLTLQTTNNLPANAAFTLIQNGTGLPVSGTFSGLAQNATLTTNGLTFRISYTGGAGNDVVLTLVSGGKPWPALGIAQQNQNVTLQWTNAASGYRLQTTTNLTAPGSWTTSTNPAPVDARARFFRLVAP